MKGRLGKSAAELLEGCCSAVRNAGGANQLLLIKAHVERLGVEAVGPVVTPEGKPADRERRRLGRAPLLARLTIGGDPQDPTSAERRRDDLGLALGGKAAGAIRVELQARLAELPDGPVYASDGDAGVLRSPPPRASAKKSYHFAVDCARRLLAVGPANPRSERAFRPGGDYFGKSDHQKRHFELLRHFGDGGPVRTQDLLDGYTKEYVIAGNMTFTPTLVIDDDSGHSGDLWKAKDNEAVFRKFLTDNGPAAGAKIAHQYGGCGDGDAHAV